MAWGNLCLQRFCFPLLPYSSVRQQTTVCLCLILQQLGTESSNDVQTGDNLLMREEEERKAEDAGHTSWILCEKSALLSKKLLLLHCKCAKITQEKLIYGFPTSYFEILKHVHAVIRFIQCWITSPFTHPHLPIHKVSMCYIPGWFPLIYSPLTQLFVSPFTPLPSRLLNSSQADHGAGQQETFPISRKLKAPLRLPTGRACWDRLLLILP